jgi:hypothetical protein
VSNAYEQWLADEREAADGPATWTEFHVWPMDVDRVEVRMTTNDDNDDGFPDAEVASITLRFPDLRSALQHTGSTRRGFYGQPVRVYVEGKPYHGSVNE